MCAVVPVVAAAFSIGSAAYGAYTSEKQGRLAKAAGERNAHIATQAAEDALQLGALEASMRRSVAARERSKAVATMLAQGIDPSSAGLASVVEGMATGSEADVELIRNNAARRAWGLRNQADASRFEGQMAAYRARSAAVGQVLGGVGGVINAFASYSAGRSSTGLEVADDSLLG